MTSDKESGWVAGTSGVPQRSILVPVLFNIFFIDLDIRTESTLSKFADETKVIEMARVPDDCAAVQTDLNKLAKWADRYEVQQR